MLGSASLHAVLSAPALLLRVERSLQGFRAKRIRLTHPTGGVLKRGISGILTETVYYIWRGKWPTNRDVEPRDILGGTTWDDTWHAPATGVLESFTMVPCEVKAAVFEEIWAAREGVTKEGSNTEGEDDAAGAASTGVKRKRAEGKTKSKRKTKNKDEKKKDGKDAGAAAAECGSFVSSAFRAGNPPQLLGGRPRITNSPAEHGSHDSLASARKFLESW